MGRVRRRLGALVYGCCAASEVGLEPFLIDAASRSNVSFFRGRKKPPFMKRELLLALVNKWYFGSFFDDGCEREVLARRCARLSALQDPLQIGRPLFVRQFEPITKSRCAISP